MKFGKTYEKTLEEQDIPQQWIQNAIQYKSLKKKINNVVVEMCEKGLTHEYINSNRVELYYTFDEDRDHMQLKPSLHSDYSRDYSRDSIDDGHDYVNQLLVTFHIFDSTQQLGENKDITENIKTTRENVPPKIAEDIHSVSMLEEDETEAQTEELHISGRAGGLEQDEGSRVRWVLANDEVFFTSLYTQYQMFGRFNDAQQNLISKKISDFATVIKHLTMDEKSLNEKYLWREVFNQYIDYKLDLSTKFSINNLNAYFNHINEIKLLQKFRHTKKNAAIFENFYMLNLELIKYLSFESLNRVALRKIIKKFDKHTLLKSSDNFNKLVKADQSSQKLFTCSIEQIIGSKIVKIIPQLDDYSCPICFNLAYKPVRFTCGHFFCLRCTVKLQRKLEEKCPICRKKVVLLAGEESIDHQMIRLMKKQFPREVKAKKTINDKEVSDEAITRLCGRKECIIM